MNTARRQQPTGGEAGLRRLEQLYEISKIFARFETIDKTFYAVLDAISAILPLRSAILIQAEERRSKMIVWAAEGERADQLAAVREHALATYAWLVGERSIEAVDVSVHAGATTLPPQAQPDGTLKKALIVMPLVVAHRPLFGALQLQGARMLDRADVVFVNAIANQLATALDRDELWRRDIARRIDAERARVDAEESGASAARERLSAVAKALVADSAREKYEALAEQNAALYEKARDAVREREQILAVVSHDLRNPLGTILLSSEALCERPENEERRVGLTQGIGRIQRAAHRMMRLIEDLLDFASIEGGRLSIQCEREDPRTMIQETLASFEDVTRGKRQRLNAEIPADLPAIDCDRDRILQVLTNLTSNASKANHEGGTIAVSAELRGDDVVFSVTDDGPGISADDVAHLFDRYWRSGEVKYKGSGLGLAIASGIVAAHDGKLWVESELGTGSKFFFSVPIASRRLRPV